MRRIVFYSWQSDLPNSTNRGFIQQALENAASAISADNSIAVDPVIDRDTQGIAGSPDIASTIFAKISAADIIVADISIVSRAKKSKPAPNPNVLIELGYALKSHGFERVILIFNRAFGKIEELPFDLRMRRCVVYDMPEVAADRATERKKLESFLVNAICAGLDAVVKPDNLKEQSEAVVSIEQAKPNRVIAIRRSLDEIFRKLDADVPEKHSDGGTVDDLTQAIGRTQEAVAEFSKIVEMAAIMDDYACALEVQRWFGRVFEKYDLSQNYTGRFSESDFDFWRFLGHELYVTLVAFLIREQRWAILERLLDEPIPIGYIRYESGPGNVYWDRACRYTALLDEESPSKQRVSLHADILNTRHKDGGLSSALPIEDFIAADFFLFLRGQLSSEENPERITWRAWSALYMDHTPMFIKNAERLQVAEQIKKTLKISGIDIFKKRLAERVGLLSRLFSRGHWDLPITNKDIDRIGTR